MYFIICVMIVFILYLKIYSEVLIRKGNSKDMVFISKKTFMNLVEKRIKLMDGFQFEDFCAMLFRLNGHKVIQTQRTNDGGYDLVLNRDTYVEIKHYSENNVIGRPIIQKLIGACVVDNVSKGMIITTSSYTKSAIECMDNCSIVDVNKWYLCDVLSLCESANSYDVLIWLGYTRSCLKGLGILEKTG